MALKLKITKASGEVTDHVITPVIQFAFEQYAKKGFRKAFLEDEKQTDIFWLAWEALRRSGESVKPFGADFIDTLADVQIEVDDSPNG